MASPVHHRRATKVRSCYSSYSYSSASSTPRGDFVSTVEQPEEGSSHAIQIKPCRINNTHVTTGSFVHDLTFLIISLTRTGEEEEGMYPPLSRSCASIFVSLCVSDSARGLSVEATLAEETPRLDAVMRD